MTDATAIPDNAITDTAVGSAIPDSPTSLSPGPATKATGRLAVFTSKPRSLNLNGRKTSIALEPAFWSYYDAMAKREGVSWTISVADLLGSPSAKGASRASVLRVAAFKGIYNILLATRSANHPTEEGSGTATAPRPTTS